MSFIAEVILLESESELSVPFEAKTKYFAHLNFNSTLQLINGISRDLQGTNSAKNELYSNKLYISMTESKSLAPSIIVSLIFVRHLVNGAQFLNAT